MDYLCIDLKSFYASVECVDRNLDALETSLVVADKTRGKGAICLAVSPKLKSLGVRNRCRLYEIPTNINYIIAKPRMNRYIEMSSYIYSIYLRFVSKEDIHVYSIDEVFIDLTCYHKLYKKKSPEIGKMIIDAIYKETGIKATCGCGPNMFLAKIAMDIYAKHIDSNIAYLDEELFKEKLWDYPKLTDFWQIGKGIEKRLNKLKLYTLRDVAHVDENILYNEFGVNASFLIEHSRGQDSTTMKDIKDYLPSQKSISISQILERDYSYQESILILKEMTDALVLDLISLNKVTNNLHLSVGYSKEGGFSVSRKISMNTSSYKIILEYLICMFEEKINRQEKIRKIGLSFGNLQDEENESIDIFVSENDLNNEKKLFKTIIDIKDRYGKSSIIRGMNLEKHSTAIKRNKLVGGHNGE